MKEKMITRLVLLLGVLTLGLSVSATAQAKGKVLSVSATAQAKSKVLSVSAKVETKGKVFSVPAKAQAESESFSENKASSKNIKAVYYEPIFGASYELEGVYSDEYFENSSKKLQEGLAVLSVVGASAAYTESYAKDFLKDCGFENIETFYKEPVINDNDTISFMFGNKKSEISGKTVVAVLLDGTSGFEWVSNFNIGTKKYKAHKGFSIAENMLYQKLKKYLSKYCKKNDVSFWIMGHSRGAAVGNLLGKRLTDSSGRENVYAYLYAVPRVSTQAEKKGYENIFNFLNPGDFFTELAPSDWGFQRYGKDIVLSGKKSVVSAMQEFFKEKTGFDYCGYSTEEKFELLDAFLKFGKSRKYYNMQEDSQKSPKRFFQKGVGYLLSKNKVATYRGLMIIREITASNQYASRIVELVMNGEEGVSDKFAYGHCRMSYVAWIFAMYG